MTATNPPQRKRRRSKFEIWEKTYQPIQMGKPGESGAVERFETYGVELDLVRAVNVHHVWTMVACNDKWRLIEGYHHVNRLFYMITLIPWRDGERHDIPYM